MSTSDTNFPSAEIFFSCSPLHRRVAPWGPQIYVEYFPSDIVGLSQVLPHGCQNSKRTMVAGVSILTYPFNFLLLHNLPNVKTACTFLPSHQWIKNFYC